MSRVGKQPGRQISPERPAVFTEIAGLSPRVSDRIALLDSSGKITAVNESWQHPIRSGFSILTDVRPGDNYLDVCRRASYSNKAREALAGIRSVMTGKAKIFRMDYACCANFETVFYRMTAVQFIHGTAAVAVLHSDITELIQAQEELSDKLHVIAHRLIAAQEEERQRISSDIHDNLGGQLVTMIFELRHIVDEQPPSTSANELRKLLSKLIDFSGGLRSLSHELHPAMLQFGGIGGALKALCEEFARTCAVHIHAEVPADSCRLAPDVALCVFRVTQECLQNIAKHSGAKKAYLVLKCDSNSVQLRVRDTGKGFVQSRRLGNGGLGLISIQERVRHLKGRVEIESRPGCGTRIEITLPICKDRPETDLEFYSQQSSSSIRKARCV